MARRIEGGSAAVKRAPAGWAMVGGAPRVVAATVAPAAGGGVAGAARTGLVTVAAGARGA